jgi:hypothetical protein
MFGRGSAVRSDHIDLSQAEMVWEVDGTPRRRFGGGAIPSATIQGSVHDQDLRAESGCLVGDWLGKVSVIRRTENVLAYLTDRELESGQCL